MMDKLNVCIFLIEDADLWEKYNTICDKVSADTKKIVSEPVYNKEFLKTNIKSYGDEVIDFYHKKISNHTFLVVIIWDSALKKMKTIIRNYFF